MKTTIINKMFNNLNDNDRVWMSNPHLHEIELLYTVKRAKEELNKLTEEEIRRTTIRNFDDEE